MPFHEMEKDIEAKVSEYAKSTGWLGYKFVSPGHRGVPDRLYIREGVVVFVEFKQLGKKPTALQAKEIRRIRKAGCVAIVIDNVTEGKYMLDQIAAGEEIIYENLK